MPALLQDLRFALRTLRKAPLFTSIAVFSLALGIGANTAIFTLMDQLMLRLLPIRDPESLVMLYQEGAHMGSNSGPRMHSYPLYQDFQKKAEPFADVICRRPVEASLSVDNQTERVDAELVSGNFFTALGVKAAAGRLFNSAEDDQVYSGHPVVVLSHEYWATRFAGDATVIGRKILVNNYPMTIVGVSGPGFTGMDPSRSPQIRVPILMKPVIMPAQQWIEMDNRRARWVQVFARLKPGYTPQSAQAGLQVLYKQIRQYEMSLPAAKDWNGWAREQFMKGTIHVEAAQGGYSQLRNNFATALTVLMWMVGLVLLIACANVANLLIARAIARQKEIAVRLSVGASRGQLIRQLLVESLTLSAVGAVFGIFLAVVITRALLSMIPSEGNPLLLKPEPDLRILLFTLLLTFVTTVLFGLVPSVKATRPGLWSTLKDTVGAIGGSGGQVLMRKALVAAQVALSFLLLFGAGLFVRSLQNLKSTNTGFKDIDTIAKFRVAPALNGYQTDRVMRFYADLQANIAAMPGVKEASYASNTVLSGSTSDSYISVEGHRTSDGEDMQAYMNWLSPGYFAATGVPLLEGRDFDRRDVKPDTKVAIVNRKFAEHFFKGKSPIGRHLGWGGGPGVKLDVEIVGMVEDSLYDGPRSGIRRQVFMPYYGNGTAAFYVRAAGSPESIFAGLRAEVKKLDATMPVFQMQTLAEQLDQTLLTERLIAMLSAGFGALATLLASIGLYGVMAFVVANRTKEIGVRMALGANPGSVVWIVMKEVLLLLGIGLLIGVPSAIALGRFVSNQLYGVKAQDPLVAVVGVVLLGGVAALAGFVPARRASRIDPLIALRYE
jgi:predicted permease